MFFVLYYINDLKKYQSPILAKCYANLQKQPVTQTVVTVITAASPALRRETVGVETSS